MNKVKLTGTVASIKVCETPENGKHVRASICSYFQQVDSHNVLCNISEWHTIVIEAAEVQQQFLQFVNGSQVTIQGMLRQNSYVDKDGKNQISNEILVSDIVDETTSPEIFHHVLLANIAKLKGVVEVMEVFENPNKYGTTISHCSFKHHVLSRWNYRQGEVAIDFKINQVFIPDYGYRILNPLTVDGVINHLKKHYKI